MRTYGFLRHVLLFLASLGSLCAEQVTYSVDGKEYTSNVRRVERGFLFDRIVMPNRELNNVTVDADQVTGSNAGDLFFFSADGHGYIPIADVPKEILAQIFKISIPEDKKKAKDELIRQQLVEQERKKDEEKRVRQIELNRQWAEADRKQKEYTKSAIDRMNNGEPLNSFDCSIILRSLKSKDVIELLGRPASTSNADKTWIYANRIVNGITGKRTDLVIYFGESSDNVISFSAGITGKKMQPYSLND